MITTENKSAITEAIAKASEQLIEALKQGESEALTQYLEVMARFRSYSFHNVLLIATQRIVTYCYTSLGSINIRVCALPPIINGTQNGRAS
jgi:hypothetical protein